MSQENVEVVRRMWDAFLAGDFETALSFCAPDIEWDGTNLPDGRIGRGHEAILDHITRWADAWDGWTVEVDRVVEAGREQVVLFMRERGGAAAGSRWTNATPSFTQLETARSCVGGVSPIQIRPSKPQG